MKILNIVIMFFLWLLSAFVLLIWVLSSQSGWEITLQTNPLQEGWSEIMILSFIVFVGLVWLVYLVVKLIEGKGDNK